MQPQHDSQLCFHCALAGWWLGVLPPLSSDTGLANHHSMWLCGVGSYDVVG